MGLDGPLGEHICLAFQLSVLVDDFQRTEQIVAGIIGKGQPVRPVIDKTIFCGKAVIEPVQFSLFILDGAEFYPCQKACFYTYVCIGLHILYVRTYAAVSYTHLTD